MTSKKRKNQQSSLVKTLPVKKRTNTTLNEIFKPFFYGYKKNIIKKVSSQLKKLKVRQRSEHIKNVKKLEEKLKSLMKVKKELKRFKTKRYQDTLIGIEQMQTNYSALSAATLQVKANENLALNELIEACRNMKEVTTTIESNKSHNNMITKFLHETLIKQNKQYKATISKKEEQVNFLLLKIVKLNQCSARLEEMYKIYDNKIWYFVVSKNRK